MQMTPRSCALKVGQQRNGAVTGASVGFIFVFVKVGK